MIKEILSVFVASVLVASCVGSAGKRSDTDTVGIQSQPVADADIVGQWYIENIVFNDSDYVRPGEEVPGVVQHMVFTDSTYSIMTNCNSISGEYVLSGDSISLGDGAMTEIACDNMAVEDALRKILPDIATVDMENDSVVRLNCGSTAGYIVLRKPTFETK